MNFIEVFNDLKSEKNVSLTTISKGTNIPITTLSNYINRGSLPGCEQLIALSDFFNVSIDYLLGHDEQKYFISANSPTQIKISEEEKEILSIFRNASQSGKNILLGNARSIEKNDPAFKKKKQA